LASSATSQGGPADAQRPEFAPGVLLDLPGAVAGGGADKVVAAHFGDPLREQRWLDQSAAVVDRSHRGVLAVPGPDRLSWLHSLTTQHLSELAPWRGAEALVLSPHGHIEHHLVLADDGGTTWIDVEPGTAGELAAFLDRMRFLLRVEPRVATDGFAVLSVVGPDTGAAVARVIGRDGLPPEPYDVRPLAGGGWARRMPWPGVDAVDLLVPRSAALEVYAIMQIPPAGLDAYEALRVAARRPRLGWETDHRTIVQEPDWLTATTHLDKGCYRGQETVARVHNLGRPPRRLVLAHLDGVAEDLPPSGTAVLAGGRQVGRVTTAARHYQLGPIALLMIKRSIPDDAELELGEPLSGTRVAIEAVTT
jgi:folate-binding protein YgfZ